MASTAPALPHGALMDGVYRWQRHIYDATRKYFLFGRDTMIAGLDLGEGGTVLEVGCGTGRNLALIAENWPRAELYGLDISAEMLKSAAAKLGPRAHLAMADATSFAPDALFARASFDRVVVSFALSMIPDWQAAMLAACAAIAPGGALHIVDFGDASGLPAPARWLLNRWLAHFHVTPRLALAASARLLATHHGLTLAAKPGPLGYYQIITLTRGD